MPYSEEIPNTIRILGFDIPVITARVSAIIGTVIAIGLGIFAYWRISKIVLQGETALILYSYKDKIVEVDQVPPSKEMIEVAEFEHLGKMVSGSQMIIQHGKRRGTDHFFVDYDGKVYFYKSKS